MNRSYNTGPDRHEVKSAREAALTVHATLLDLTRIQYEREHGRVGDGLSLWQLVANDPAFAWLSPLTSLIAGMDEVLVDKEARTGEARVLVNAVRDLLRADANGGPFQRRYFEAVQTSPDVAVVHRQAVQTLNRRSLGTM